MMLIEQSSMLKSKCDIKVKLTNDIFFSGWGQFAAQVVFEFVYEFVDDSV